MHTTKAHTHMRVGPSSPPSTTTPSRWSNVQARPEHSTGQTGLKNQGFLGRENHAHARPMGRVRPQFSGQARDWVGHPCILLCKTTKNNI
jgi:hypothetical protein